MLLYKLITMHNIGYAMHSDAYQCCNSSTSGQAVVFECVQRQDPCKYHRMSPAAFAYAKPLYFLFTLSLFSVFEIGIILFRRRLLTHTGGIQSYSVSYSLVGYSRIQCLIHWWDTVVFSVLCLLSTHKSGTLAAC